LCEHGAFAQEDGSRRANFQVKIIYRKGWLAPAMSDMLQLVAKIGNTQCTT